MRPRPHPYPRDWVIVYCEKHDRAIVEDEGLHRVLLDHGEMAPGFIPLGFRYAGGSTETRPAYVSFE